MMTKDQRDNLRFEFANRHREYFDGRGILTALDIWREQHPDGEPIFTREHWEAMGANYPTIADRRAEQALRDAKLRYEIARRCEGSSYAREIIERAFQAAKKQGAVDLNEHIRLARRWVYRQVQQRQQMVEPEPVEDGV